MGARRGPLTTIVDFASRWFAGLVLAGGLVGLVLPDQTARLSEHVPLLLGVIMFGMGLTLRPVDFALVLRRPWAVLCGLSAQFVIMPLTAVAVGWLFGLSGLLLTGMVLVSCAPGARPQCDRLPLAGRCRVVGDADLGGHDALAGVDPAVGALAGRFGLPVGFTDLFSSIVQVVLLPVTAGLVLRVVAGRYVKKVLPYLPLVSVTGIVVVVAAIVGANADAVVSSGILLVAAVIVHNGLGLLLGYFAAKLARLDESACRAVSVEVGMQNSGLSASLATAHFTPLAALPAALFSVWHNVSGSILASYWAKRPTRKTQRRSARRR